MSTRRAHRPTTARALAAAGVALVMVLLGAGSAGALPAEPDGETPAVLQPDDACAEVSAAPDAVDTSDVTAELAADGAATAECEVGLVAPVVIERSSVGQPADACPEVEGVQTDPAECEVGLIPPVVLERDPPVVEAPEPEPAEQPVAPPTTRRPTEVAGIQVFPDSAAVADGEELPRTGSGTSTVAVAGFGLVLLGVGSMIAARRAVEAPVR